MVRTKQPVKYPCVETGSDRLSNLPSHIVDQILSSLSIRDAVRTSILSSKWRYKWASLPNLIIDKDCYPPSSEEQSIFKSKIVNIVDHVLLLHTGSIHKFKLSHKDLQATPEIDRWVLYISRIPVKEFILEIWKGQRYQIPSCLYSSKNLVHLELFNCLLSVPLSFEGFPHLKCLDLQHITLAQDAFEALIANSPLLERLTLMNFEGFNHLKIRAPNLQFFDIGGIFQDISFENTRLLSIISIGLYVNAPVGNSLWKGTCNLLKFFNQVPRIQRLEIQSYFLRYLAVGNVPEKLPAACLYLNYLSLRINFNDPLETNAAFCLFRSSPNLYELEMLARPEPEDESNSRTKALPNFWTGNNNSECVFGNLRVVRVFEISMAQSELDFMKFLLANSPKLEKLTVKPAAVDGGTEFLRELLRYRRASVLAEVIYMDP